MRRRSAEICVHVPTTVALYILNQKRDSLVQLEARYGIRVLVARDDALVPPAFRLERLRAYTPAETAVLSTAPLTQAPIPDEDEAIDEAEEISEPDQEDEEERGRSRRRRRRRRRREEELTTHPTAFEAGAEEEPAEDESELAVDNGRTELSDRDGDGDSDAERRRRRRGRRGGRRRGRRESGVEHDFEGPRPASDTVEILPAPEVEESEPALVEARAAWPVEIQSAAIETASLPALAGDPPTANASMTEASAGEHVSSARDDNAEFSAQDLQAIHEAAREEASAELAPPPTAEVEQGVSYASNTEFGFREGSRHGRSGGEAGAGTSHPNRDRKAGEPTSRLVATSDPAVAARRLPCLRLNSALD